MTDVERSYASSGLRLGLLAAGLFVVGTNAFVIAGVLPEIAGTFRTSPATVGFAITWYAVVVAIASPLVSTLFARTSRTRLMAIGMLLVAAGTAVAALAPGLVVFTAGRVIAALGGAALVPVATAAAPTMLPPERRGTALATVTLGFTLSNAIGAPLGTALAAAGGWRLPLLVLAALGAVLAGALARWARGIPVPAPIPLGRRFAVLKDSRIVLVLVSTLLLLAGFNAAYLYSSLVARPATGGAPALLSFLLLLCGVGGVVGTALAGRLTDRIGSGRTATIAIGGDAIALAALPVSAGALVPLAIVFLAWGALANGVVPPLQARLIAVDPAEAGLSLAWYSTAMYVGIALAPVLADVLLPAGAGAIPLAGGVAALLALVLFHLGRLRRTAVPVV